MSSTNHQTSKSTSFGSWGISKGMGGNRYQLQCIGNQEVTVEGCKGIMQYEQDVIRLNVGSGQINIQGRNLSIPVYDRNCVQVEGIITNIEFI